MGRRALDVLRTVCDQLGYNQITTVENEEQLAKDDRKLVRALNRTLRVLSGVQDWRFLRTDSEIITAVAYTQGLARVTAGSATVTGQDDPDVTDTLLPVWTTAMVGRAFVTSVSQLTYRIAAVNSATSLTLNRAWQNDSTGPGVGEGGADVDDLAYSILQDRYDMPSDMDRPVDETWTLYRETDAMPVRVVDAQEVKVRRMTRAPSATDDDPDVVTLWDNDDQLEHRVAVFDPFPRVQRVIAFEYQRIHPTIDRDTQRILFPPRYEEVVLGGVEFLMRSGPDDDSRSDMALSEYLRARTETMAAREVGQQRMRFTPSQARAWEQRNKWRRRGARIDWHSKFDDKSFFDLGR